MPEYFDFFYRHIELSIAFIAISVLLLWEEFGSKRFSRYSIAPEGSVELINHSNAVVLDIRAPENFTQGHIIRSLNIPTKTLGSNLKKLAKYKNTPIIIVDEQAPKAISALKLLKQNDFQKLHILSGGLGAWQKAGLPLVK